MTFLQKTVRTALAVTLILAATPALAWTGPTSAPPGGNVSTPLNIGGTGQTKTGYLGLGGAAPSYPLTITGPSANWAEAINWPPSSAPGYGILVGTYAGGYSQFQNNSGYYIQLAVGANGLATNGNLYNGATWFTNGDIYMPWAGNYLSTYLNSTIPNGNYGHKFGGGFGTGPGGCFIGNNFTGGCSCPGFAPNVQQITNQNDRTGSWYAGYTCYGS